MKPTLSFAKLWLLVSLAMAAMFFSFYPEASRWSLLVLPLASVLLSLLLYGFYAPSSRRAGRPKGFASRVAATSGGAGLFGLAAAGTMAAAQADDKPAFNIDGSPMLGDFDANGNPYGVTGRDPFEHTFHDSGPSFNVDGTAMHGSFDSNGNTYGNT